MNTIRMLGMIELLEEEITQQDNKESILPQEIQNAIINHRAVAASDSSIKDNLMATHWIISTLDQDNEIEGGVESRQWGDGLIAAGEAIGVLDLVKYIVQRSKNLI